MAIFPFGSAGKESAHNSGDMGLVPGLGRSPGEGNGSPLKYSCLKNPMERGAWWATIHTVAKSHEWATWIWSKYDICSMWMMDTQIPILLCIFFNWGIIALQCCVNLWYTLMKWISYVYIYPIYQCQTLFLGAQKSLRMVTAALKLKDVYSLEEKLCPT